MSDCTGPSRVLGRCPGENSSVWQTAGRLRSSSRRSGPGRGKQVVHRAVAGVVAAGDRAALTGARAVPQFALGCGTTGAVRGARRVRRAVDVGARQPCVPEQRNRYGRPPGHSRIVQRSSVTECGGSVGRRATSARHNSGCQARSGLARRVGALHPADEESGRWRIRGGTGRPVAGSPRNAGPAQLGLSAPIRSGPDVWPGSRHHGSSRLAVDHLKQRPGHRLGDHGSSSVYR